MSPSRSSGAAEAPLSLQVMSSGEGATSVAASGRITRETLDAGVSLESVIGEDAFSGAVLLGLSDSDYMDSSGVGWLLQCHKRAQSAGGRLIVHSAPPMIDNLMRILKLEKVLALAKDAAAAKALAAADADQ